MVGSDDAEERRSGAVDLSSTDLELVTDGTRSRPSAFASGSSRCRPGDDRPVVDPVLRRRGHDGRHDPRRRGAGRGRRGDVHHRERRRVAAAQDPDRRLGARRVEPNGGRSAARRTPTSPSPPARRLAAGLATGNAMAFIVTRTRNRTAVAREKSATASPVLHLEYR